MFGTTNKRKAGTRTSLSGPQTSRTPAAPATERFFFRGICRIRRRESYCGGATLAELRRLPGNEDGSRHSGPDVARHRPRRARRRQRRAAEQARESARRPHPHVSDSRPAAVCATAAAAGLHDRRCALARLVDPRPILCAGAAGRHLAIVAAARRVARIPRARAGGRGAGGGAGRLRAAPGGRGHFAARPGRHLAPDGRHPQGTRHPRVAGTHPRHVRDTSETRPTRCAATSGPARSRCRPRLQRSARWWGWPDWRWSVCPASTASSPCGPRPSMKANPRSP